jgi:hypothetical protein
VIEIRVRETVAWVAMALVCYAPSVLAQTPASPQTPPPAQGRGAGQRQGAPPDVPANMTAAELDRFFDSYEIFQAQSSLQLDNATFLSFGARYQQFQKVRREHQQARQKQLNELNDLMKPDVVTDEATLAAKTKALDDLEAQEAQDYQKALLAVDQVLTVKQRARLRVFMNNMERKKLDLLALARQQAQQIKLPDPGPPAPPAGKIIK